MLHLGISALVLASALSNVGHLVARPALEAPEYLRYSAHTQITKASAYEEQGLVNPKPQQHYQHVYSGSQEGNALAGSFDAMGEFMPYAEGQEQLFNSMLENYPTAAGDED
ncbi:hypothetical protein [Aliagarivorans marinus]|uniref:hypothetical protein n=1 Tax=Aliagarivorans marinus TaxID=561965 RepID=UPI000404F8D7|nr:hypothetical protein [Aliagarivorans marinus]